MIKNEIVDTMALIDEPQIKSTTDTFNGQSLRVAKFVRSYVEYEANPNKRPANKAYFQLSLASAGLITKNTSPSIKMIANNTVGMILGLSLII